MSFGVSGASLFGSTSQTDGSSSNSLRPFANLNLSEAQRTQIRSIFQNAKSQGLSKSEVQQQIGAILTPAQQTTLQSDLAAQSSTSSANSTSSQSSTSSQNASASTNGPIDNLNLTDDQKSKIDTILQNAQTSGTSQSDVLAQIQGVLTPNQQSAFLQDVQTAQAVVSGQSQNGSGGTGSSSTLSSTLTETDVQNQIAAATSLLIQQFQSNLPT